MSENTEEAFDLPSSISPWIELLLGMVAVVGLLWSVISFFNPLGNVDATVWVQQEIPVAPPAVGSPGSLQLFYDGLPIERATILQVNISNTGAEPIGEKGTWENISITPDDKARIALLSQPTTNPTNLEFQVLTNTLTDTLTLQFGLLNPRDAIDLQLIVIEPEDVNHPKLIAETRIPKLSQITVTRESVNERLEKAFETPVRYLVFGACVLLFLVLTRHEIVSDKVALVFALLFGWLFATSGVIQVAVWLAIRLNK